MYLYEISKDNDSNEMKLSGIIQKIVITNEFRKVPNGFIKKTEKNYKNCQKM